MRLICPNCGAQYEVPVEVIPDDGRDVQCSNCGHTWFQNHPDADADLAEELEQPLPQDDWGSEDDEDDDVWDETDDPAATTPPPHLRQATAEQPRSRGLDPSVAEVLREEAEREAQQRAAEAFESQPDLGLEEPDEDEQARRSREARERMARMRGEDPVDGQNTQNAISSTRSAAAAAAAASSRRELLPDVDEINQTLRPAQETRAVDTDTGRISIDAPKRKGGFARGFSLVVLLAAAALAVYVFAPAISEKVPAAAPYLETYVERVNTGRAWLDEQVTGVLQKLDGMSSEAQPPAAPAPTSDNGT